MPVRQPRPAERTLYVVNKTLEDPPLLEPEAWSANRERDRRVGQWLLTTY